MIPSGLRGREPERGTREARVPRWLLWALVGTSLAGIAALAFLGGFLAARWQSGGGSSASPVAAAPASVGVSPPASTNAGPLAPAPPAGAAVATTPTPSVGAQSAGEPNVTTRAEVAAYFAQAEAILSAAQQSGDPETLARKILGEAAGGDTRGLDQIVTQQRELSRKLGDLRPPAPCAEYHRRTVELMEKSARYLETARDAIASGNTDSLAPLALLGGELQTETRALDALGQEIKKRYLGTGI